MLTIKGISQELGEGFRGSECIKSRSVWWRDLSTSRRRRSSTRSHRRRWSRSALPPNGEEPPVKGGSSAQHGEGYDN